MKSVVRLVFYSSYEFFVSRLSVVRSGEKQTENWQILQIINVDVSGKLLMLSPRFAIYAMQHKNEWLDRTLKNVTQKFMQ